MAREELTRLTGNGNGECGEDDCPNVYRTERGTFVVQGDVSDAFTPPQGEGLVEFSRFRPPAWPHLRPSLAAPHVPLRSPPSG
ncbi:hypothetical protein ACIBJF_09190 [Streptomyces sp. NPDC050743]|uniref:hypothetical protein n=1 Tax=Streptomyces sp. NPDC050743 TaxID=3365634 RepID=UPI0037AE1602